MTGSFVLNIADYTNEKGVTRFHTPDFGVGNIVSVEVAVNALQAAVQAVILGVIQKDTLSTVGDTSLAVPTLPTAQRENVWLVSFMDDVNGRPGSVSLPTADISNPALLNGNSDDADLTDPLWVEFITTMEAIALSVSGNPITVKRIERRGRNT